MTIKNQPQRSPIGNLDSGKPARAGRAKSGVINLEFEPRLKLSGAPERNPPLDHFSCYFAASDNARHRRARYALCAIPSDEDGFNVPVEQTSRCNVITKGRLRPALRVLTGNRSRVEQGNHLSGSSKGGEP